MELTDLEVSILIHLRKAGYKYIAFNDGHARAFDTDEKPVLKGYMFRVEEEGTTIFGDTIFVPGLFEQKGYELLELDKLEYQEALF